MFEKIWIKVNEDGSLGRAYKASQMNFRATPPPGITYIETHVTGIVYGKTREDEDRDSETNTEVSVSAQAD